MKTVLTWCLIHIYARSCIGIYHRHHQSTESSTIQSMRDTSTCDTEVAITRTVWWIQDQSWWVAVPRIQYHTKRISVENRNLFLCGHSPNNLLTLWKLTWNKSKKKKKKKKKEEANNITPVCIHKHKLWQTQPIHTISIPISTIFPNRYRKCAEYFIGVLETYSVYMWITEYRVNISTIFSSQYDSFIRCCSRSSPCLQCMAHASRVPAPPFPRVKLLYSLFTNHIKLSFFFFFFSGPCWNFPPYFFLFSFWIWKCERVEFFLKKKKKKTALNYDYWHMNMMKDSYYSITYPLMPKIRGDSWQSPKYSGVFVRTNLPARATVPSKRRGILYFYYFLVSSLYSAQWNMAYLYVTKWSTLVNLAITNVYFPMNLLKQRKVQR